MKQKIYFLTILVIISIFFGFTDLNYPNPYLEKMFYTSISLFIIYLIFKVIFEGIIAKKIKDSRTKYSFRKTVSIIYLLVFLLVILRVWVENTQTLIVSYGLITAGVAISLQDVFKNFAGGLMIFISGIYRVGDRIEVNSRYGDVIDIGILSTTLMELRGWVSGDQATGRLAIIPNGYVLSNTVINYNRDHNFIWDEINIPLTYDSDWKLATEKFLEITRSETGSTIIKAEKELQKLGEKYYLSKRIVEPSLFITLTDNWVNFSLRYITEITDRRSLSNRLHKRILEEVLRSEKIKIASETYDISIRQG